jgi:hypothetical protein
MLFEESSGAGGQDYSVPEPNKQDSFSIFFRQTAIVSIVQVPRP